MDLSFGKEYEVFRREVRNFLQKNADKAARNNGQWLGSPELVREEAARLQGLVAA